jgi:hypothetical protein
MPDVQLAPGAEDVPMAGMLAEMLKGNLENPVKVKVFNKLKARVYIFAEDAEAGITLNFEKGRLTVYGGQEGQPDLAITTDATTLLELANINIKAGMPWYFDETGRSILRKLFKKELKIKGMYAHLLKLTAVTKVMSLN